VVKQKKVSGTRALYKNKFAIGASQQICKKSAVKKTAVRKTSFFLDANIMT
jgi:hypothetical protein